MAQLPDGRFVVFTCDQVVSLTAFQRDRRLHPFTCPNRAEQHPPLREGEDHGLLVPTMAGWICQFCDYKQNWAHDFMLTWPR